MKISEFDTCELVLSFSLIKNTLHKEILSTEASMCDVLFVKIFNNADDLLHDLIEFNILGL